MEKVAITELLDTCLTAGKIMTESGSEVYRVEDTMDRIAESAGEHKSTSYVTATGLFMGIKGSPYTQLENINERSIDLNKVAEVNQLSRQLANKELPFPIFAESIRNLSTVPPLFSMPLKIFCAGAVSCTLMYIFGGSWVDFLPTFLVGSVGYATHRGVKKLAPLRFLNDFVAAFVIGLLAYLMTTWQFGHEIDHIIIGAVMPLVPGVAITNSFRDILAGHLLSGTARGTEAVFSAAAIGTGIAIVFKLFY